MPDVLHVVVILHCVEELFHQLDILFGFELLVLRGDLLDLRGDERIALLAERVRDGVEIVGIGVDAGV